MGSTVYVGVWHVYARSPHAVTVDGLVLGADAPLQLSVHSLSLSLSRLLASPLLFGESLLLYVILYASLHAS
jgi:hypothetical protein